jgi:transcription-repair coupling factor (superfamily II helicase)
MEKILLKGEKMICYFVSEQESEYYQSNIFGSIIRYVQSNVTTCRMKETGNRLSLVFDQVETVDQAIKLIGSITIKSDPEKVIEV